MEFMIISAKAARVNANLKLDQAAGELGITRRTLQNYEAGRTSPPWEIVEKMSRLYKYPIGGISFALQSTKSTSGEG